MALSGGNPRLIFRLLERFPGPALLAAIAFVPALAACQTAPDGAYPSLAIRDVERAQGQLEPVPGDPIDVPPVV